MIGTIRLHQLRAKQLHELIAALAVFWGTGFLQAAAAAPASDEQSGSLEPVVVTASRAGAESLQDVPMSISALVPDELAAKGIAAMGDFLRTVPGVVLNSEDPGVNRIVMRGLVTRDLDFTNLQDRSLVAVYLDEIPIGLNMANPDLRVVEMERIEVIRGPQGTLYGAGSMAGTVRYITKKPDPKEMFGQVETGLSSTTRGGLNWDVKGSVNMPVVQDKIALRLGAYRESQDGYIDNIGTGQKRANSVGNTQANAALRWIASDALTADASVTYQKLDVDGFNGVFSRLNGAYTSSTPVGLKDKLKIFNLTLAYDTGSFDLISSTSYLDRRFALESSFDYLFEAIFGFSLPSPSAEVSKIGNFTQEIRAVSKPGNLTWQVGAFYAKNNRHYVQDTFATGLDAILGIPSTDLNAPNADELYYGDIRVNEKQWALFGEATYRFTEKLSLTAGLRYFDFKDDASYIQGGIAGVDAILQPVNLAAAEKSDGINPKILFSYKPHDEMMIFAEAARGFRYGGVNYPVPDSFCAASLAKDGLTSAPLTFGPDKVWSYSIGEKGTFLERRLMINTTAFLINWDNAQTNHPLDCGYPFTENGGKIRSAGLEFEGRVKVSEGLVMGVNATYTDAKSIGGIPTISARDGDKVPYFPKWMAAVSADYTWTLASGTLGFATDYSYRGPMGTEFNPTRSIYRTIPSSGVVNASLNYKTGMWKVGLFATNLTDSKQIASIKAQTYPNQPGDQVFLGRPRTMGLRLQRDF